MDPDEIVNIELQVLGSALRAVAEEMGAVLVHSAFSANIKEPGLLDRLVRRGRRMIAQAEHIPVHLGAMPEAVAAVRERDPRPGDVFVVNDPFTGGTHLPDITLVSRTGVGYAVSRAHYADVGGAEPASLPASSTDIYQEGLVVPPVRLTEEVLTILFANMRNPDERRGDRAQLAAHRLADARLDELVDRRGPDRVEAAMTELFAYSERRVRAAIASLPDGRYEASDTLEAQDGELVVRAAVTVAGDEIEIDFAGTDRQHDGNLNCPLAVTRSAAYFVVRCLTDPDVPASGGAFAPVRVQAPEGSLVNARRPAAVVAGNVETSSRIADVSSAPSARPSRCPPRAGDDEQSRVRQRALLVLRDDRRRPGRMPVRRRPVGRARRDVEHAQHARRGARALVPTQVERYALRLGSGEGRFWGRRRRHPGDHGARAVPGLDRQRAARSRAERDAGRCRARRTGRNLVDGDPVPAKVTLSLDAGESVTIETPGGGGFGYAA